jgi:hypothetical protein
MSGADQSAASEVRWFTTALSDTPIADEYRALESALRHGRGVDCAFNPAPYPVQVLQKAREWWLAIMRSEYESASGFVELEMQFREIDAPIDVQAVVLRMAQDELRHAAICANVVERLGGEAKILAPPMRRSVVHADCGLDEAVLRTVIFGCCLSETVNAARLAKRLAYTSDPFVREAIRQILADERLHAQFGFYYLESRRQWLETRPAVRNSIARYLQYGFAVLEQYMGAVPHGARSPSNLERDLGIPDLTDLSTTFQETMLNASVPGLERFGIEAATAWRDRSIMPKVRDLPAS